MFHQATVANFDDYIWQSANLPKAFDLTAQQWVSTQSNPVVAPRITTIEQWLPEYAQRYQLDARQSTPTYSMLKQWLSQPLTIFIRLTDNQYLVVVRGGRWRVQVLRADGTTQYVMKRSIQRLIAHYIPIPEWDVPAIDADRITRYNHIIGEEFRQNQACMVWQIKPDWSYRGTLWQLRRSGVLSILGMMIAVQLVSYTILFTAIWLLTQAALTRPVAWSQLVAGIGVWSLRIPLAILLSWLEQRLTLRFGVLFNTQLFNAMRGLSPAQIATEGTGFWLGKMLQAQQLLEGWLNRGVWLIYGVVFILLGLGVLLVTGQFALSAALVAWFMLALLGVVYYIYRADAIQTTYFNLNQNLLEKLMAHETRRVQERDWFSASDRESADYITEALKQDRLLALLWLIIPYGALILALLAIAVSFVPTGIPFVNNALPSFQLLVILFMVLQYQYIALSTPDVAQIVVAWLQTARLRQQGHRSIKPVTNQFTVDAYPDKALIELQDVTFGYRSDRPVLRSANGVIYTGDHILLQGQSGIGKTTLANLLSGVMRLQDGLLLLAGYDPYTIGKDKWQSEILLVPQFYQNHLFDASLAFNLLMGRQYPPSDDDLQEAEYLCRQMNLGKLLDQMPDGIHQHVGVTGWRLSHGERNRVFVIRALLQVKTCLILDETLSALDPDSVQTVMRIIRERAKTLIVITQES